MKLITHILIYMCV